MEKIWKVAPKKFEDPVEQILFNRDIIGDEEIKKFLKPDFEKDLHDPFLMKNLEKTALEIQTASKNGEKIGIFADYDADGIPAAALLFKALKQIGIHSEIYIPSREGGYGLSEEGIDYLISKKCEMIVTVDLGIRNIEEAKYCREKNIKLIITDHHLPGDEIPSADLVINPKQKNDKYPFKELCGCGVAFKLVQGLSKLYPKELDEKFLKWNLDLVAISTIADVVPLNGENRIFAKFGLQVMGKTRNIGLAELIKISALKSEKIGAYEVGFQIAPRINAPGRIDHATKSFELLITEDPDEAKELALWLNEKNETRQLLMDKVEAEAIAKIEKENLAQNKIIIVSGTWQKGILGPTASRLVEKFSRPIILFSQGETEYTGSARSISGVNIVELFEKVKLTIKKFGGHKGAAGISVEKDRFEQFKTAIITLANETISDEMLQKKVNIDLEIQPAKLTKKLYEEIILLEPFGLGNPRPIFMSENIEMAFPRFVGKEENHLSFKVKDGDKLIKAISFRFPHEKSMIANTHHFDILYSIEMDEWNGEENLNLKVSDIKISE